MTISHAPHSGPIDEARSAELAKLLDNPQFSAAVAAYKTEADGYDLPYAGGSDITGKVVFWDRHLSAAIKAKQFIVDGKPIDPRPAGKVHEAVEGAQIRILGKPYLPSHDLADIAEAHAVAHLGWPWLAYQAAWRPFVKAEEREKIQRPPPTLLLEAYRGTPLWAHLIKFQTPEAKDYNIEMARRMTGGAKLGHEAVAYGPGRAPEFCIGCRSFRGPGSCVNVADPVKPQGWCSLWVKRGTHA